MNSNGTIIKFSKISVTLPFDNESVCLYTNINNNDRLPSIDLNKLIGSPIYMYNYLAGYIKEFSIEENNRHIDCIIEPSLMFAQHSMLNQCIISMKIDMNNLATYVKNIDVCLSVYNTMIGILEDKVEDNCYYCN